jgi:hypothetical protein
MVARMACVRLTRFNLPRPYTRQKFSAALRAIASFGVLIKCKLQFVLLNAFVFFLEVDAPAPIPIGKPFRAGDGAVAVAPGIVFPAGIDEIFGR